MQKGCENHRSGTLGNARRTGAAGNLRVAGELITMTPALGIIADRKVCVHNDPYFPLRSSTAVVHDIAAVVFDVAAPVPPPRPSMLTSAHIRMSHEPTLFALLLGSTPFHATTLYLGCRTLTAGRPSSAPPQSLSDALSYRIWATLYASPSCVVCAVGFTPLSLCSAHATDLQAHPFAVALCTTSRRSHAAPPPLSPRSSVFDPYLPLPPHAFSLTRCSGAAEIAAHRQMHLRYFGDDTDETVPSCARPCPPTHRSSTPAHRPGSLVTQTLRVTSPRAPVPLAAQAAVRLSRLLAISRSRTIRSSDYDADRRAPDVLYNCGYVQVAAPICNSIRDPRPRYPQCRLIHFRHHLPPPQIPRRSFCATRSFRCVLASGTSVRTYYAFVCEQLLLVLRRERGLEVVMCSANAPVPVPVSIPLPPILPSFTSLATPRGVHTSARGTSQPTTIPIATATGMRVARPPRCITAAARRARCELALLRTVDAGARLLVLPLTLASALHAVPPPFPLVLALYRYWCTPSLSLRR
ncbi:hypothetical protein B0H14DRAFT_3429116 [Mycena olivaceomarginata]|nr:hypothetical protein B0H14DRAFT_3429116 [Mycena olivaceomarginata]